MDTQGLRIGQDWDRVLRSAVADCDYFLVLQSRNLALRDFSYVRAEVSLALEKQGRAENGITYLLPALLDDAEPMTELRHLQHTPLRSEQDLEALVRAIHEDFGQRRP